MQEKQTVLESLEVEKEAKRLIKEEAENLEKAALDVIREEEDRIRAQKEEFERAEKEAETTYFFKKFDKNADGLVSKEELMHQIALDQNNDGIVNEEEVNFYLSGHDNYDQETFINTGWLLMKHLFSKFQVKAAESANIREVTTDEEAPDADTEDYDYDDLDGDDKDDIPPVTEEPIEDDQQDQPEVAPESQPQYSPHVQALVDAANAARDEYNTASSAHSDVNHDVQVKTKAHHAHAQQLTKVFKSSRALQLTKLNNSAHATS